ncbi:hypothetical protein QQF64_000132 [Cirrhinus molitorella]|uniref:Uncharacterized protein n=1 Tax=Cirrhinus molitorella TaxID=172907 RepID=A0ABR3NWM9_9TELE
MMFPLGDRFIPDSFRQLNKHTHSTLKLTREHMNTVQTSVRRIDRSITINKALNKSTVRRLAAAHARRRELITHTNVDPSVMTLSLYRFQTYEIGQREQTETNKQNFCL